MCEGDEGTHLFVNGKLSQVAAPDRQAVPVIGKGAAKRGIADAADRLGYFDDLAIGGLGFDDERERFPPVSPVERDGVLEQSGAPLVAPRRQLADDAVIRSVRKEGGVRGREEKDRRSAFETTCSMNRGSS